MNYKDPPSDHNHMVAYEISAYHQCGLMIPLPLPILKKMFYTIKPYLDFWLIVLYCHFQQYFSCIMATSFSGGRSWREPPTMGNQLVNFITCGCESSAPFFCNLQSRARTHAVLVIGLYELLGNPTT
jgi:hypothetical protein